MIPRRTPLKRSGIKRNKFGNVKQMHDGRSYASGLERDTYLMLQDEQRQGKIKQLETQITHGLYVGYGDARCTCQWPQGKPMEDGMERIYSPVLDFQFYERVDAGGDRDEYFIVYADAKGYQDAKQRQGYKLFAAIHRQKIRLYTAHGIK